jgi:hypothetical protein
MRVSPSLMPALYSKLTISVREVGCRPPKGGQRGWENKKNRGRIFITKPRFLEKPKASLQKIELAGAYQRVGPAFGA